MGIVEKRLKHLTIHSLVEPRKFPVGFLLRKLTTPMFSMHNLVIRSISNLSPRGLNQAFSMEYEIDKMYWLVVRQLVLAVKGKEIGREIGIDSPTHVLGNRTVANALEHISESLYIIGSELQEEFQKSEPVNLRATMHEIAE